MAVSKEKKIELLTQSFETLKNRIKTSSSDLSEINSIIEKMIELDLDIAIAIWQFTLENYTFYSDWNGNATYYVTSSILDHCIYSFGIDKTLHLLNVNTLIKEKLFKESYCVSYDFFIKIIENNKLYEFTEYCDIIEQNTNFMAYDGDDNLGKLYEYISGMIKVASEDAVELLLNNSNKLSEESKAIVSVNLLKFM